MNYLVRSMRCISVTLSLMSLVLLASQSLVRAEVWTGFNNSNNTGDEFVTSSIESEFIRRERVDRSELLRQMAA